MKVRPLDEELKPDIRFGGLFSSLRVFKVFEAYGRKGRIRTFECTAYETVALCLWRPCDIRVRHVAFALRLEGL